VDSLQSCGRGHSRRSTSTMEAGDAPPSPTPMDPKPSPPFLYSRALPAPSCSGGGAHLPTLVQEAPPGALTMEVGDAPPPMDPEPSPPSLCSGALPAPSCSGGGAHPPALVQEALPCGSDPLPPPVNSLALDLPRVEECTGERIPSLMHRAMPLNQVQVSYHRFVFIA
jgi:hypothetical protein